MLSVVSLFAKCLHGMPKNDHQFAITNLLIGAKLSLEQSNQIFK
jgi:hypothetical protein